MWARQLVLLRRFRFGIEVAELARRELGEPDRVVGLIVDNAPRRAGDSRQRPFLHVARLGVNLANLAVRHHLGEPGVAILIERDAV